MKRRITDRGQYLIRVAKGNAVLTWLDMGPDALLDAVEALHELLEQGRFIPFWRTGRLTKDQVLITRLDPNDEDEISVDFPDLTGKGE